jgi:hypothetical protein
MRPAVVALLNIEAPFLRSRPERRRERRNLGKRALRNHEQECAYSKRFRMTITNYNNRRGGPEPD